MKRQKITIGSILEIHVDKKYYVYSQILEHASYAFFDFKSNQKLTDFSVLEGAKVLFIVAVYDYVVNQGKWLKVGKLPLRESFKNKPLKFIHWPHDKVKWGIYDPNTGEIRNSTKEDCKGLEVAAVYEAEHVEERLSDHYAGRPNRYRQKDLDMFNDI
jgi:Immunity protein 26